MTKLRLLQPCALRAEDLPRVAGGRGCATCLTVLPEMDALRPGEVPVCGIFNKVDLPAPFVARAQKWLDCARVARVGGFADLYELVEPAGVPADGLDKLNRPGAPLEESWSALTFMESVVWAAVLGVPVRLLVDEVSRACPMAELDDALLRTPVWDALRTLVAASAGGSAAPLDFSLVGHALGGARVIAQPPSPRPPVLEEEQWVGTVDEEPTWVGSVAVDPGIELEDASELSPVPEPQGWLRRTWSKLTRS